MKNRPFSTAHSLLLSAFDPTPQQREINATQKVVVGMSGGVDSSVAALLLKYQGYQVVGVFMKNWEETDERGQCLATLEYRDVVRVCEDLDIPYYSVNFVEEYRRDVFEYFLQEYRLGHTPNPDILCNREIKFKAFFKMALQDFQADFLATGHYCRRQLWRPSSQGEEIAQSTYCLHKGSDPGKDQSYFLYTLKSHILERVLFPVGDLPKEQVRTLAREFQLHNSAKKDSTGICFIGERKFMQFLQQFIPQHPGNFCTLRGEVVGTHQGVAYYTNGQRKGLGLGGPGRPWFVVDKDVAKNIIYVERGEEHPALFRDYLWASDWTWVDDGATAHSYPFQCMAKVRYRQQDQPCVVEGWEPAGEGAGEGAGTEASAGRLKISFLSPQRAITPRQSIVLYAGEVCLGGGIIDGLGPSYFEMQKDVAHLAGGVGLSL